MTLGAPYYRLLLGSAAAMALGACDAATQIAGEAAQGEARGMIEAQCREVAQNAGIVADRVAEVCECSARTFVTNGDFSPEAISRGRVEEIVNGCARSTGPEIGTAETQNLPTEEAGG